MKIYGIEIPFKYLKWIIIGLTIITILSLIVWIICSYYIFKWFKISIDNYNFYLNDYNKECRNILEQYGDLPVKKIYLVRHPISKFMETFLNIVTFNKFKEELNRYKERNNTDSFFPFHTMLYIELKISKNESKFLVIDKNNCIRISPTLKMTNNCELRNLKVKRNKYTLHEILETTRKRIGNNKYFNWEISKNNCQEFIKEILITIKKFTKSNQKFMFQNQFIEEIKISDFSFHIISSLTNTINLLENIVGAAIWIPV